MADWRNYLEGDYDELIFHNPYNTDDTDNMNPIVKDTLTAKEIAAEVTERFEEYKNSEKMKRYLIDGACLRCSKSTLDSCKLLDGTEICLSGVSNMTGREKTDRRTTILHVKKEESNMLIGKSLNATVLDCKQGELAELDAKTDEEGEGEVSFSANIYPFRCNCAEDVDRIEEQEIIKANEEECMKNGVCQYLMKLDNIWENLPAEHERFYEKKTVKIPIITDDGEKEISIDADCITMTSVLFCKHGGLITPYRSGQGVSVQVKWERIHHLVNWDQEKIKLAKYVTQAMLAQGYRKEFIAGVVGNVVNEGRFGKFESSAYEGENLKNKPKYLDHMDKYHNYANVASGLFLKDLGIQIFDKLKRTSECEKNIDEKGNSLHKYGLGFVQWTGDRYDILEAKYKEKFGNEGKPTYEQCRDLEIGYMLEEFSNNVTGIVTKVNDKLKEQSGVEAVSSITILVHDEYESPKEGSLSKRIEDAKLWYQVLDGQYYEVYKIE